MVLQGCPPPGAGPPQGLVAVPVDFFKFPGPLKTISIAAALFSGLVPTLFLFFHLLDNKCFQI